MQHNIMKNMNVFDYICTIEIGYRIDKHITPDSYLYSVDFIKPI